MFSTLGNVQAQTVQWSTDSCQLPVVNKSVIVKKPGAIDYHNYLAYRCHERGDIAGSAQNFLLYLEEPVKRGMTKAQQDSLYSADRVVYDQAAANAMYLFYSIGDMDGVLKVLPYGRRIVLHDTPDLKLPGGATKGMTNVYITSLEAAKEKGLDDLYVELLKEAVERCPQNPNFTEKLVAYYLTMKDKKMAQAELDQLLAKYPDSADLWYAKGELYLDPNNCDNTSARNCFAKAIALNERHAHAYAAMGNTYIQDVMELRWKGKFNYVFSVAEQKVKQSKYKKELAEVQPYYYNARTYLETARQLEPENYPLWGDQLLACYKILNQKDKYDALVKEMKEE